jgi:hypothetical protein
MAKKQNPILLLSIFGVIGYAGYELYKRTRPKAPVIPVEPTPGVTPGLPTPKSTPAKAPSNDINQLQQLMVQWYRGKTIQNVNYTDAEAKGGWGTKSQLALKTLFPKIYASNGDITANNIAMYIKLMKDNLEKRGTEEKLSQTKQAGVTALDKLVKQLVAQNNTGRRALKVLVPFTAVQHKYDRARNSYIALGETKQFRKGATIPPGTTLDRRNGQILLKGTLSNEKDIVYPTNPNNLYVG